MSEQEILIADQAGGKPVSMRESSDAAAPTLIQRVDVGPGPEPHSNIFIRSVDLEGSVFNFKPDGKYSVCTLLDTIVTFDDGTEQYKTLAESAVPVGESSQIVVSVDIESDYGVDTRSKTMTVTPVLLGTNDQPLGILTPHVFDITGQDITRYYGSGNCHDSMRGNLSVSAMTVANGAWNNTYWEASNPAGLTEADWLRLTFDQGSNFDRIAVIIETDAVDARIAVYDDVGTRNHLYIARTMCDGYQVFQLSTILNYKDIRIGSTIDPGTYYRVYMVLVGDDPVNPEDTCVHSDYWSAYTMRPNAGFAMAPVKTWDTLGAKKIAFICTDVERPASVYAYVI